MPDDILKWGALLAALASPIAVVVTLRMQSKFSEWRHEQHDKRIADHDARLRMQETKVAVLEARTAPPATSP